MTDHITAAAEAARAVADRAGVVIDAADDIDTLTAIEALVNETWSSTTMTEITMGWLRGIATAGGYVAAAHDAGRLVGTCIGFWGPPNAAHLHSHLAAVEPDVRARGVGVALKVHQRWWALTQGAHSVGWTYDPLARRNLVFNLVRLGARPVAYLPDHYGPADDPMNAGLPTDRALVEWDLGGPPLGEEVPRDGVVVLTEDESGMPARAAWPGSGTIVVGTPTDVMALRHSDPRVALAWQEAMAATLGRALAEGGRVLGGTRAGDYVVDLDPVAG